MRRTGYLATARRGLTALLLCVSTTAAAEEFRRLAPYAAIRWQEKSPEVRLDGRWYRLRAIDDIEARAIVEFCVKTYGDRWQKRFDEDLVEVLSRMGRPPGDAVDLTVVDGESGEGRLFRQVPMTAANRQAIWLGRNRQALRISRGDRPRRRARREHAHEPAAEFRWLIEPPLAPPERGGPTLSRAEAAADLDELEWHIEKRFSYRDRRGVDYRAALDTIRGALAESVPVTAFSLQLLELLALFGDGHSRVTSPPLPSSDGFAPFLLGEARGGVVGFLPDRSGFVGAGHPHVVSIDGVTVDRWLEAAARFVPHGSPQFVRHHALRLLRHVAFLRRRLGLPATPHVTLQLRSPAGAERSVRLELSASYPTYGDWPRTRSRRLDGDVGYLRLPSMDGDTRSILAAHESMRDFSAARALIIDVRGNGGGSRDLLRTLLPYFLRGGEAQVVNVAAYRLDEDEAPDAGEGYLANRFLYPATFSRWSDTARRAIRQIAGTFEPGWRPPAGDFSTWHYMVIERPAPDGPPPFRGPVVVLLDSGCFSATDIFLGAFKGRPNVTLVGTASGGGSGRAREIELEHSRIRVRLSSMASFRPDGRLYDGNGIDPDRRVEPEPDYFIGGADAQLEAALESLER